MQRLEPNRWIVPLAALFAIGTVLGGRACHRPKATFAELSAGGRLFRIQVLQQPSDQAKGYRGVDRVKPNEGILFMFPNPLPLAFWMKGCHVPLDMVFLDGNMTVQTILTALPEPEQKINEDYLRYTMQGPMSLQEVEASVPRLRPSRAVLEVAGGEMTKLGIKPGERLVFKRTL